MRQKIISITRSIRLPSICTLCNQFHKSTLAVCAECIQLMSRLGCRCVQCAYPLPDDGYLICGHCIKNPPHFDATFIAYSFEEPLRSLLHQFKYYNGLYLANLFCHLMVQAWDTDRPKPQCLIPVPMHPSRLKARGFNQAAILTKLLARKLSLPFDLTSCKKVINTAPQAGLDSEQRQKNLKGVFHTAPMTYEHVALVDDLLTTGSTANEIAFSLKNAGVKRVDVWCCARTIVKNS
ncbi:ComF family protein [Legionella shakespearei]|uniref:Competence protein ComF n=1 Tax=Legionella shakespearei DSM 23087 TaxID=1122169 RepID=A0A0W0YKY0_9GAMM|nr:competence protein ComF [Legionella shakespearei DSM 23087]